MTWQVDTFFGRLIQRLVRLPWWLLTSLIAGFLCLPFALASLERLPVFPLTIWSWRDVFFPVVGTAYVIAVTPAIWRAEHAVVEGLKPLAHGPPPASGGAWWRSSWGDWVAFGLGVLGSMALAVSNMPEQLYWVDYYIVLTYNVMYGSLAWLIYAAMGSARMTALLHRNLRPHNPFDLSPFEPVGRQALVLAMIFVGAITLSLFFVYAPGLFFDWRGLIIYGVLTTATVGLFFGAMWPAHRTLLRVKTQEQAAMQRQVTQSFERLQAGLAAGDECQPMAARFETWLALAQRLEQTPTWPYNLVMLRTLALSVLTPVFVALFRVIGVYLSEGHL
jgi:hypothetical protein